MTTANTTNLTEALKAARRHNINAVSQLLALGYLLASDPELVSLSQLARAINTSATGATLIADALVKEDLAFRQHGTADRRVIFLTLTRKGREAALEILSA